MTSILPFVKMDNYKKDLNTVIGETDQVIDEINAFHCGDIVELLYFCSERLAGVYTSPGNKEMSHDEKRIMAKGMVEKCIEDIVEVSQLGLTYTADSNAIDVLNDRVLQLSNSSGSLKKPQIHNENKLQAIVTYVSDDIKRLADYIRTSRDLNINGDSNLGDNDKSLVRIDPFKIELEYAARATHESPCESCDGKWEKE